LSFVIWKAGSEDFAKSHGLRKSAWRAGLMAGENGEINVFQHVFEKKSCFSIDGLNYSSNMLIY
jgi:hypothetical protein